MYFRLDADRRPLLAEMLGGGDLQDLVTVVAELQRQPVPTWSYSTSSRRSPPSRSCALFARARSAGISLMLGTQELADLRRRGDGALREQVLGNWTVIAHRQEVPGVGGADRGDVPGTRSGWRVSRHSGGATTRTRTRHALLQANDVMRLGTGWAAVLALADAQGPPVRITRILPPDGQLGGRR